MVRWKVERRAPRTMRIEKWLGLTRRLADTIRNSDLNESNRMRLARWIDNQIDRQCVFSQIISKESGKPTEFDASILVRNRILPEHLYARATESMDKIRAFDLATELEQYVDTYVQLNAQSADGVDLRACTEIISAADWINFWLSKGFGFETIL